MNWQPIVVGVDASHAAAGAASFAHRAAVAAGTRCQLVHGIPQAWSAIPAAQLPYHVEQLKAGLVTQARREIIVGLRDVVRELDAGLVVLGGKHHTALGRWLGGSTAHHAIRTLPVPVLVTRGAPGAVRHVLVALDLSGAAAPTLAAAERWAALFGAELKVVSVVEPLPTVPEVPAPAVRDYYDACEEGLRKDVWPLVRYPNAETVLRHGAAADVVSTEAARWPADLLVVGSHGKGWAERVLIGSVTERLFNHLPTSLLVVPVGRGDAAASTAVATRAEATV